MGPIVILMGDHEVHVIPLRNHCMSLIKSTRS